MMVRVNESIAPAAAVIGVGDIAVLITVAAIAIGLPAALPILFTLRIFNSLFDPTATSQRLFAKLIDTTLLIFRNPLWIDTHAGDVVPMPVTTNKVEDPCQECRDRHLKCDDNRPKCSQCVRLGEKCRRMGGKLKFRVGSSARYDATFDKHQPWLQQSKNAKIQFVDQGPELENYYAQDDDEHTSRISPHAEAGDRAENNGSNDAAKSAQQPRSTTFSPPPLPVLPKSPSTGEKAMSDLQIRSPASASENLGHSSLKRSRPDDDVGYLPERRTEQWTPPSTTYDPIKFSYRVYESPSDPSPYDWDGISFVNESNNVPKVVEAEYRRLADSAAGAIPPEILLTPSIWKEQFYWPNQFTTTQCACLMRYYIEHLAPWFDVGDPARSFTLVVPQRARRCPPLLNAIFTAAARRLAALDRFRGSDGVVRYQGISLPRLNSGTAVQYHNAAIAYLIKLSDDPVHVRDENLLAAAVILRYYEELDTPFTGEDTETFLRTFQIFINAQANNPSHYPNASPLSSDMWRPRSANSNPEVRFSALAYIRSFPNSCFRVALRQEITIAFMRQRALHLKFDSWLLPILQSFEEAEDYVWADRHLLHCANVLQFCFGGTTTLGRSQTERWNELKAFEISWEQNKPLSFSPIHYEEPNRGLSEVFPKIWYMAETHVSGMQYLDLARILLTVYNPSIPRLGPGATAAQRRIAEDVRGIVIRLCGIALSAPVTQPALVQAYMAVAICGEYFVDRLEQEKLLEILTTLEHDHGWPTSKTAGDLKIEWGW